MAGGHASGDVEADTVVGHDERRRSRVLAKCHDDMAGPRMARRVAQGFANELE